MRRVISLPPVAMSMPTRAPIRRSSQVPAPGYRGSDAQSIKCAAGRTRPGTRTRTGQAAACATMCPSRMAAKLREPSQSGRSDQYFHRMCSPLGTGCPRPRGNLRSRKSESAAASCGAVARMSMRSAGNRGSVTPCHSPSTASTASCATAISRSISAALTTSGGAKNRMSPGAG